MRLVESRFYLKPLVSTEMKKCRSDVLAKCDDNLNPVLSSLWKNDPDRGPKKGINHPSPNRRPPHRWTLKKEQRGACLRWACRSGRCFS